MIRRSSDGKVRALSLSYGKDSLACLGAIEALGWPLDRIIHTELWATDTIPADFPAMVGFKTKADAIIKDRFGFEVEHIKAERTYEQNFYRTKPDSCKYPGTIYGFPLQRGPWCNYHLKLPALRKAERGAISYLGIAADEPERSCKLDEMHLSPLVAAGWTEAMCRRWCEDNDLLSPIYTSAERGGCWFCHNQSVDQLRLLRRNHPELWSILLKWDEDSPVEFRADKHTVRDFDKRFQLEDEGKAPSNKKFRWKIIKELME